MSPEERRKRQAHRMLWGGGYRPEETAKREAAAQIRKAVLRLENEIDALKKQLEKLEAE